MGGEGIYHACVIFQDVTSFMLSTDALIDMLARLGAQVRLNGESPRRSMNCPPLSISQYSRLTSNPSRLTKPSNRDELRAVLRRAVGVGHPPAPSDN
jgi:hypothetical protein